MNNNKVSIARALLAITTGVLLVAYPDYTTKLMVIAIGLLFLIPGLISIVSTFIRTKKPVDEEFIKEHRKAFPILGIGSSILGLVMVIIPMVFITAVMYILGATLVIAGIYQIIGYRSYSDIIITPVWIYAVSVLIILAGIFIFLNPIETASLPFFVLGISSMVYGISEFINIFRIKKMLGKEQRRIESLENIGTADNAD